MFHSNHLGRGATPFINRPLNFDDLLTIPEIVQMVFEHLDTYADVLRFGVTNTFIWKCGERRIRDLYQQERAPWRGHRLICLGDYVGDLPDQLNNAKSLCELATTVGYSHRDCHVWFDADASEKWTRRLEKLSQGIYENATVVQRGFHLRTDYQLLEDVRSVPGAAAWVNNPRVYGFFTNTKRYSHYGNSIDSDETDAEEVEAYLEPPEPIMVLRNLSKRVYLRSDTLPFTRYDTVWGFGRAVLSRICWSTDPSVSMVCQGDISRGVWAGDRFDVVELDDFIEEIESSGWKDVTSEVREELIALWTSNYQEIS